MITQKQIDERRNKYHADVFVMVGLLVFAIGASIYSLVHNQDKDFIYGIVVSILLFAGLASYWIFKFLPSQSKLITLLRQKDFEDYTRKAEAAVWARNDRKGRF